MEATVNPVKHRLDESTFTLVSLGESPSGVPLQLTVSWETEELMADHLELAMSSAEKYIRDFDELQGEAQADSVYAGAGAEGASTSMRRFRLPFGRELLAYRFKAHEYDEAAMRLGSLKLTVPLKLTGEVRWSALKLSREASSSGIFFGVGGASGGFFLALPRLHRA